MGGAGGDWERRRRPIQSTRIQFGSIEKKDRKNEKEIKKRKK
jgi:hypothetical protein